MLRKLLFCFIVSTSKIHFIRKALFNFQSIRIFFTHLEAFIVKQILCGEQNKEVVMQELSKFKYQYKSKWQKCNKNKERFYINEKS